MSDDPPSSKGELPEPASPPAQPVAPEPPSVKPPDIMSPDFSKQRKRHRRVTEGEIKAAREAAEIALQNVLALEQSTEEEPARRAGITRFARASGTPLKSAISPSSSGDAPEPGQEEGASDGEETLPPSEQAAGAPMPKFKPRTVGKRPGAEAQRLNNLSFLRMALYGLLVAGVAVGVFFAGWRSAPRTDPVEAKAPEIVQPAPWPQASSDLLEKALVADHAGDPATALKLTDELIKSVALTPALRAYRGNLGTRLGHTKDTEAELSRFTGREVPPEAVAMINSARAFNFVRQRMFDRAIFCFKSVAEIDPLDFKNLFYWAETLRRRGSLTEAIDKFQEALLRVPDNDSPYVKAQREYIAYERRLTQVENGQGATLEAEIRQQLGAPAPSGYWLMTAAAAALQKGDVPSIVDALTKAQAVFSPEEFRTLLSDYFFRSTAYNPEMGVFPISSTPEQKRIRRLSMDYFVDP